MPGTESAAADSGSVGSFSIAGAPPDTQTEDAILDGTTPAEGAAAVEPAAGTEPAGKTAEPGAEPAAGATADGKPAEGEPGAAAAEQLPTAGIPVELTALLKDPLVAAKLQPIMPKIQAAFDQNASYRELYPTVREAREFRETFPTLEDAKSAATKSALLDEADEQFAGPPEQQTALATEWADSDPVAFLSMFTESAKVLQAKNPQGFEQVTQSIFTERIRAAEWDEQIAAIGDALRKGDVDRLKGLANWLVQDSAKRGIEWNPRTGRVDPAVEAAQRERTQAAEERQAAVTERITFFQQRVGGSVETQVKSTIANSIAQTLKDSAFTEQGRNAIKAEIFTNLDAKIRADKNVQKQLVQIIKGQNGKIDTSKEAHAKAVTLLTNRAKALLNTVAKEVIARRTAEVVASTQQVNDRRTQAASRTDVGAGGASPVVRTRKLTPADTATMTDDQIMDL